MPTTTANGRPDLSGSSILKPRTGRVCIQNLWEERRRLEAPGTEIYADRDGLFANPPFYKASPVA